MVDSLLLSFNQRHAAEQFFAPGVPRTIEVKGLQPAHRYRVEFLGLHEVSPIVVTTAGSDVVELVGLPAVEEQKGESHLYDPFPGRAIWKQLTHYTSRPWHNVLATIHFGAPVSTHRLEEAVRTASRRASELQATNPSLQSPERGTNKPYRLGVMASDLDGSMAPMMGALSNPGARLAAELSFRSDRWLWWPGSTDRIRQHISEEEAHLPPPFIGDLSWMAAAAEGTSLCLTMNEFNGFEGDYLHRAGLDGWITPYHLFNKPPFTTPLGETAMDCALMCLQLKPAVVASPTEENLLFNTLAQPQFSCNAAVRHAQNDGGVAKMSRMSTYTAMTKRSDAIGLHDTVTRAVGQAFAQAWGHLELRQVGVNYCILVSWCLMCVVRSPANGKYWQRFWVH